MNSNRVSELEKEFITWSNILDTELIKYYYSRDKFSHEYLLDKDSFFHGLLADLDSKNEEYIRLTKSQWAHPNFEKASWRLNLILDIIYCEIESRKQ